MISILSYLFISVSVSPFILQEKIEAKVGDRIITTLDIDPLLERLIIENPTESKTTLRLKARDVLIDQALISVYLARYEMQVKDEDLNSQVRAIRDNYGYKSDLAFREFIESKHGSFDRFKDQIRWQIERNRFYDSIQRQAVHTKDDKELLNYFQRNKSAFDRNLEIELEECVLPGNDAETEARALSFAKNPKDFGVCIKKWSKGASANNGGKLGKFVNGVLPEELEQKVFALKEGAVLTNRITTGTAEGDRIQLLKAVKIRDLGPRKFEDVRKEIEARLDQEKLSAEVARVVASLKSNTVIQLF